MAEKFDQQSPTKDQTFTKVYKLHSKSYEIRLNFKAKTAILRFSVADQSDVHNYQHFTNRFSLEQTD